MTSATGGRQRAKRELNEGKVMSVSRQKVSAVLRRAGFTAAKWNRSGQVRGWGDWSSGIRVVDQSSYTDRIRVFFQTTRFGNKDFARTQNEKASAALTAAGIENAVTDDGLMIYVNPLTPTQESK